MKYQSRSSEDTVNFAAEFALLLKPNTVLALRGDLGAGKTTFVKGIAHGLGADPHVISSPTFSYLHIYEAKFPIYHFDLYRLSSSRQFELSGFEEYFHAGGIACIEWPSLASEALPKNTILIDLRHAGEGLREITIGEGL